MPAQSSDTLALQPAARVTELQQGPTAHKTYRLIQVLRAIAAEMVVVRHATTLLHLRDPRDFSIWNNGVTGVDIFFVISGFVMIISTAPLLGSAHPARTFFARRAERIAPMYWLASTAKVLALFAAPTIAVVGLGRWWHVLGSYLFFPTRSPIGAYGSVLAVGWTLIFEMFFYVLFAIVLATRLPRLPVLAPVLILLAFARTIPFVERHGTLHFYANTMQLEFLFGMLLATSIPRARKIPGSLAILLGIAGFVPLLLWNPPLAVLWGGILWGVPALAVVTAAVALESPFGARAPRWLLEIGDASYSIYLVHGFVVPVVGILFARFGGRGPYILPLALMAAIIVATVAGDLVYRLIERPMIEWFRGRRRAAIPANA
ncbi:MAG TPA: acyltransferase [Candidatus Aquilonibacter sp.]|nr:acyltransferase [Candidatus Aquilonibacter sp.]